MYRLNGRYYHNLWGGGDISPVKKAHLQGRSDTVNMIPLERIYSFARKIGHCKHDSFGEDLFICEEDWTL